MFGLKLIFTVSEWCPTRLCEFAPIKAGDFRHKYQIILGDIGSEDLSFIYRLWKIVFCNFASPSNATTFSFLDETFRNSYHSYQETISFEYQVPNIWTLFVLLIFNLITSPSLRHTEDNKKIVFLPAVLFLKTQNSAEIPSRILSVLHIINNTISICPAWMTKSIRAVLLTHQSQLKITFFSLIPMNDFWHFATRRCCEQTSNVEDASFVDQTRPLDVVARAKHHSLVE